LGAAQAAREEFKRALLDASSDNLSFVELTSCRPDDDRQHIDCNMVEIKRFRKLSLRPKSLSDHRSMCLSSDYDEVGFVTSRISDALWKMDSRNKCGDV
jgi:hypothetical protein